MPVSRSRIALCLADLLDEDYSLVEKNSFYRCLDKVLKHKEQLFAHLRQRWQDLFGARFEVLLYDLTSTYFESDSVFEETDKRQFGYSRDVVLHAVSGNGNHDKIGNEGKDSGQIGREILGLWQRAVA